MESAALTEVVDVMAQVRAVTLPSGIKLEYAEQGDASGTPVVLLHGVTDSWRSFEPALPHLPASIRAVAVSQRGHGDSSRPDTYRTSDFAADVEALLSALGIEEAVIVGHSMGATNAMRFAVEHPRRTRALVLAGAFARFDDKAGLHDFWINGIRPLADPVDPELVRAFQSDTLARPVAADFFEMVVAESLKLPARVWRGAFDGFMENGMWPRLGEIAGPALLLWGAHDTFVSRADQDVLLDTIPGARLVVYEDAGHALHWEEPRRFAHDVAGFVNEVARNGSPRA